MFRGLVNIWKRRVMKRRLLPVSPQKITPDSLTAVRDYQELTNSLYKKHPTAWNPEATGNERCKDRHYF
jgi:hypothetical protein